MQGEMLSASSLFLIALAGIRDLGLGNGRAHHSARNVMEQLGLARSHYDVLIQAGTLSS